MKKILISITALFIMSLPSVSHANGAAMCVAMEKNSNNVRIDKEYFIRYGGGSDTTGYHADTKAREDFREKYSSTPSCRNSARKFMNGGYFVIIESGRKKDYSGAYYNRWGIGFGNTRAEALIDAKKHLSNRDWGWNERKHGYKVDESGIF